MVTLLIVLLVITFILFVINITINIVNNFKINSLLKKDCENCMITESFCDVLFGILRKIESGRVDEAKKTVQDILSEFNYEYALLSDSIDDNKK